MSQVWIALGANLGDREAALGRALLELRQAGVRPLRISHVYETSPEPDPRGDADAPPAYLNAVLLAETELEPRPLLAALHEIERRLGRDPAHREGPRTIDLDLLSVGPLVVDQPGLTLPHPRLHARAFVLVPLCELDPTWRHPALDRTAGELLGALVVPAGDVRLFGPPPSLPRADDAAPEYAWRLVSSTGP